MPDPFTMVYDALWDLAEGSGRVTDLVRVGNRIKLRETRTAGDKKQISQGDLPEMILGLTSGTGNIRGTSSSSSCIKQFQWGLSTGDLNPERLLELEFALFAAMVNWPNVLAVLEWGGATFVKRAQLVSMEAGQSMAEQNRGIRGWVALWTLEVEMHFRSQTLIEFGMGSGS